jgi:pilus assembly protein Flp/PilA
MDRNFFKPFGVTSLKETTMLAQFFNEEDGAQFVEYALIIAVVSIALVVALQTLTTGATFTNFIGRVNTCLTTAVCV